MIIRDMSSASHFRIVLCARILPGHTTNPDSYAGNDVSGAFRGGT
jgi:hypothetical protein